MRYVWNSIFILFINPYRYLLLYIYSNIQMEIYLRCKVLMDVDGVTQWIDLKVGEWGCFSMVRWLDDCLGGCEFCMILCYSVAI
jgi:hypothetical protein